jgi:hypothetical protein
MDSALVREIFPQVGSLLLPGAKLLDIKVDLSLAVTHDCPPESHHRIALRERAWLRQRLVGVGDEVVVGAPLLILTTDPDEDWETGPQRAARVTQVGILPQTNWWDQSV